MKTLEQLLAIKSIQEVITISPDATVFDALKVMDKYHIGALAVLENDTLVGIFSERDYAREVALKGRTSKTTTIKEVMTTNVYAAKPDDTVENAMNVMSDKRIRHLPVLDGHKMIGILSIGDLVKETIAYQQELIQQLETYINS